MAFNWTDDEKRRALACCELFEGTPHMQRRSTPGRGVDCVQLVVAVLQEAGVLPAFRWPQYRQDIGWNLDRNHLGDLMAEVFHAEKLDPADWEPQTGDVGIFKCGRTTNHCGIFVNGRFWHVTVDAPAHHCALRVVHRSLQEVVRITDRGLKSAPENLKTT